MSAQSAAAFAVGHQVGAIAQSQYPGGVTLFEAGTRDFNGAVERTRTALQKRGVFYEAAFSAHDVFVAADIVKKTGAGVRVLEVKSAGSVKPYHVEDCATQAYVMRASGVHVRAVYVAHIDTSFVYKGDGDYGGLFEEESVTREVNALQPSVPKWIEAAKATLSGDEPVVPTGSHCNTPFECPFTSHCHRNAPEYPTALLPNIRKAIRADWQARGLQDLRQIPRGELHNARQERIYDATVSGSPFVDRTASETVRSAGYPRYYLDFETINFAVPRWAKTKPYQQVPFQWSIDIETGPGIFAEQQYFLDTSGADPSRACAAALVAALGSKGSIFVYSSFESRVILDLAERCPDLKEQLVRIEKRLFDLLPVARAAYYHPSMKASWSIKKLLPAIGGPSYEGLAIGNGGAAQEGYLEAIEPTTTAERRDQIRADLIEYCGQDSKATASIAAFFSN